MSTCICSSAISVRHPAGAAPRSRARPCLAVVARQRTHEADERVLHRHVADHARAGEVTGQRRKHDDVARWRSISSARQSSRAQTKAVSRLEPRRQRPGGVVGGPARHRTPWPPALATSTRRCGRTSSRAAASASLHVDSAGGIARNSQPAEPCGHAPSSCGEATAHQLHAPPPAAIELFGHRRADAGAAAGDECDLAGHGICVNSFALVSLLQSTLGFEARARLTERAVFVVPTARPNGLAGAPLGAALTPTAPARSAAQRSASIMVGALVLPLTSEGITERVAHAQPRHAVHAQSADRPRPCASLPMRQVPLGW